MYTQLHLLSACPLLSSNELYAIQLMHMQERKSSVTFVRCIYSYFHLTDGFPFERVTIMQFCKR
jgi:hypothetical protein